MLAALRPSEPRLCAGGNVVRLPTVCGTNRLQGLVGSQTLASSAPAADSARRSHLQRTVDEFLPRIDRPRPQPPLPQRRSRGSREGRCRQLLAPACRRRTGQRVRERNPRLAGRAGIRRVARGLPAGTTKRPKGSRYFFFALAFSLSKFWLTLNVVIRVIKSRGIGLSNGNCTVPFPPS